MFCKKCGKEIADDAKFCPSCGDTVAATSEKKEEAVTVEIPKDEISVGFSILSFLIPIFGIIYYFVKRKQFKTKAEACLISAIGGIVLAIIVM